MKFLVLTGIALIAAPVLAQTASAPDAQAVPSTPLSTAPTPADGPRAQEGNLPSNNGTAATPGAQPATPDMSGPVTPQTPVITTPSPAVADAMPAPAPKDHYPVCKKGQFDQCIEPGNRHKK